MATRTRKELLDMQFIDARSRVIDVAAFLDRMDRHAGEGDGDDHRLSALRRALPILLSDAPGRAKAVLEALSDTSESMPECAAFQGASGAPPASAAK